MLLASCLDKHGPFMFVSGPFLRAFNQFMAISKVNLDLAKISLEQALLPENIFSALELFGIGPSDLSSYLFVDCEFACWHLSTHRALMLYLEDLAGALETEGVLT